MAKKLEDVFEALSFFIFPAIVLFLSLFFDFFFNIYQILPWIDIPFHFFGGFSISYSCFLVLKTFKKRKKSKSISLKFFVISLVLIVFLMAFFWEVTEFFLDFYYQTSFFGNLNDGLTDLVMGLFGGISVPFLVLIFRNFDFS